MPRYSKILSALFLCRTISEFTSKLSTDAFIPKDFSFKFWKSALLMLLDSNGIKATFSLLFSKNLLNSSWSISSAILSNPPANLKNKKFYFLQHKKYFEKIFSFYFLLKKWFTLSLAEAYQIFFLNSLQDNHIYRHQSKYLASSLHSYPLWFQSKLHNNSQVLLPAFHQL